MTGEDRPDGERPGESVGPPEAGSADPAALPADVRAVLAQLFDRAADRVREEPAVAASLLETAETVAGNKVPDPERRDRLTTGCRTARDLLASDPTAAEGYLRALERRVCAPED